MFAIEVLIGDWKTTIGGGYYVAHWSYVEGWYENGGYYYSPSDEPGQIDDEYQLDLPTANLRWGSNAAALNALNLDYGYVYCTASCITVPTLLFDLSW
ncbi:MAG: hypothetical protein IT582_05075 [Opitutaceae bacterium]|nr:hypothetical protein [Opitutaceae bacterium]